MYNPTAPSPSIMRKFSVSPLDDTDRLSKRKVYPVLFIGTWQDQGYFAVRGNDGVIVYADPSKCIIEFIEP